MSLLVPVILGSVRTERQGIKAAKFVIAKLRERGHEPVLVDPMELDLPLLDRMYKEYPRGEAPEKLERLADLYRRADGFIIVSAEYNQSVPPALKNTLDYFLEEYFWRPSTIVSYSAGRFGGVRAAIALRPILAEMGMPSLPSILAIPSIGNSLGEDGTAMEDWIDRSAAKWLDEFEWYATALKAKREADGTPS
ncbi:NADPH-dependent FMN reductase [Aurantimonas manganoxydans]|uniref:NADPH-dependent FMN reductase n=1 Tax=Aurantimonas manganoxydans TaxID=651183 RepID=UPI0002E13C18|nr:NAD(P)H-dependent oxidoreductase [Aurantimonas manganoxydans]